MSDKENPEWTKADFDQAKSPDEVLSSKILSAFPKSRGAQKAPKKIPISIRLSPEVIKYYKSTGPGWQGKIDDDLKKAADL